MRIFVITTLAVAAAVASPAISAQSHGGGYRGSGGGHSAGGAYYGHGSGYGYGGWRHGYPGYGYGIGIGLGLGYAAGWGWPWYWGGPRVVYAAPAYYPYGYPASDYAALAVNENLTYVQQPQAEVVLPAPARRSAGYWYYCTAPAGYYPYVQQCSKPWVQVLPQTTPPPGSAPESAPPQ